MPSRNTIEVVINATDNASRVFNSLSDNTQKLGKTIGVGITAGLAVATTALTGFAVRGLQEFATFEKGMKEVFTLLPGISQDAMNTMTEQVKTLSKTFGVLPEQTIPALYQALSAGVPPDNIYEFLTIANKAAIGGVTDLETAVDGITSVVNAYGADIIDATKASDLMFTAVRLGKTNFEQLSQSLFQVIPTASALGVSFEDVTAGLAAITAQGTPTNVATTQMRQLFVELSKDAGKTSDIFKELAGKSFKDFIAQGGNTQEALQLLEKHAQATGLGINDLFGSVEAGNAALQLTGKGTERFTDFLGQMGQAAGATDEAFKTMSESLQYQINRTNAKLSVLFINIGEKLAPAFAPLVEEFGNIIGWFADLIAGGTSLEDFISYDLPQAFRPLARIILSVSREIGRITNILKRFFAGVNAGVPFLDNLRSVMYALFPKSTADAINVIINGLNTLWMKVKPVIDSVIQFVKENVKLEDVLIAIGVAIASFVIPAIISIAGAIAPVLITFGLLVGAVTLLRRVWETDFIGIRTFVLEKLIPALETLADWFLNDALPKATDFIENVALPAIQLFINWLGGIWDKVKPGLEALANWFISNALPGIINFITNSVIPAIGTFIGILIGIWNTVSPELDKLFKWFFEDALPKIMNFINTEVIPRIGELGTTISGIWEVVRPELEKFAAWFLTDALPKIRDFILNTVLPALGELLKVLVNLWNTVAPELGKILTWFVTGTGLTDIKNAVVDFADLFAENSALLKGLGALVAILVTSGSGVGLSGLLTGLGTALRGVWTAALPVAGALGALVLAAYGLIDAVEKFQADIAGGVEKASGDLAERVAAGITSKQDIADAAFAELQRQYGDVGARIMYHLGAVEYQSEAVYQNALKIGTDINRGVIDGVTNSTGDVLNAVTTLSDSVKNRVQEDYGIQSPSTVFSDYGENLILGLTQGLESIFPQVTEKLTAMKEMVVNFMNQLKTAVTINMTNIVKSFTDGFNKILNIFNQIAPQITTQVNSIIAVLNQLKIQIASTLAAISMVGSAMSGVGTTNLGSSGTGFGYANGLPYAPRTMPITVHKGERVLTAQENQQYSNNQNQSSSPMINIENLVLGDIKNQSDANEKARMFVNGLRAQGMEI